MMDITAVIMEEDFMAAIMEGIMEEVITAAMAHLLLADC
jgi:hypothetical protein